MEVHQGLVQRPVVVAAGSANSTCAACSKTAYPLEKVTVDDKTYHKGCMRCAHCNKVLSPGNYSANLGKLYCKPHLLQLFKLSGNYNSGFGSEPHKNKWEKPGGLGAAGAETIQAVPAAAAPGRQQPVPGALAAAAQIAGSTSNVEPFGRQRAQPGGGGGNYRAAATTGGGGSSPSLNAAPSLRERLSKYETEISASNGETKRSAGSLENMGRSVEGRRNEPGRRSAGSLVSARRASFETAIEQQQSSNGRAGGSSSRQGELAASENVSAKIGALAQEPAAGTRRPKVSSAGDGPFAAASVQSAGEPRARNQWSSSEGSGKKKHVEIVEKRDSDDTYAHTYDARTVEVYHKSLELSPPLVRSQAALASTDDEARYDTFVRRADSQDMTHAAAALSEKGLVEEDELTYLRELVRKYKHQIASLREQLIQRDQMLEEPAQIIAGRS